MKPFERDESQQEEKRISETTPRRGTMASFRRFGKHIINDDDPEGGGFKRKADSDDVKPSKKSKPAVTCAICLDDVTERGTIDSCDHQFCYKCIQEWSKRKNTCPNCRLSFNTIRKGRQTERVPTTDIPTGPSLIQQLFMHFAIITSQAELAQSLTLQRHDGRGISNETAIDLVSDDEQPEIIEEMHEIMEPNEVWEEAHEIIESGHREEDWSDL